MVLRYKDISSIQSIMNKKKDDNGPRLSYAEIQKKSAEARAAATKKALEADKVRYTSTNDPEKFKTFLEKKINRLLVKNLCAFLTQCVEKVVENRFPSCLIPHEN